MILYIDIGNSKIKFNYKNNYFYYLTKKRYTLDLFFNLLSEELKAQKFSKIFICSVVPRMTNVIYKMCIKYWNIKPTLLQYPIKTNIKILTDSPKEVGADLIALATYAASNSKNAIIVNLGTATTIVQVKNNELIGIIICPGLSLSFNALIKNANKLHNFDLNFKEKNIGQNTIDSISIGVLNGHTQMIKGLVSKLNKNSKLFISGGDAQKISFLLPKYELIHEATIEGMKIIQKLNK